MCAAFAVLAENPLSVKGGTEIIIVKNTDSVVKKNVFLPDTR